MGNSCCSKDDAGPGTDARAAPQLRGLPYVILVDPVSTGAALAAQFYGRAKLIRVDACQSEDLRTHVSEPYRHVKYEFQVEFDNDEPVFEVAVKKCHKEIMRRLPANEQPVACVSGAECGVEVAELLASYFGLPTNDPKTSLARRDKYLMGEKVRAAGVRAVQQKLCSEWSEVTKFVETTQFNPFNYIIKPCNSAGSDNVRLCKSLAELKKGFDAIVNKKNVLGILETHCLVQECLGGDEYVVDTVSRNGIHKTVTIWIYDKRLCNDAAFVYFGMRMVDGESAIGRTVSTYIHSCLDALDIRNSAGHSEVKMTPTGPCLIECGARPHGGDGTWMSMTQHCLGYSQVTAIVESWLDMETFSALPVVPRPKKACLECILVSRRAGILADPPMPRWEEVRKLSTYHDSDVTLKAGTFMPITVNFLTTPGSVILLGETQEQVEKDFDTIREMEFNGLYSYEEGIPVAGDYQKSPIFQRKLSLTASPRSFRVTTAPPPDLRVLNI